MSIRFTPVIICGGSGTRLWPASRKSLPKQFIALTQSDHSLFQEAVLRLDELDSAADVVVVCSEEHRFLVAEQLRQINRKASAILLEPVGRNTAAAITAAAQWIALEPALTHSQILIFPADHYIPNATKLAEACELSRNSGQQGYISVFGVKPTRPETGYGYIECHENDPATGNFSVAYFKEKPDSNTASSYCDSGLHYWNSGIFAFQAETLLTESKKHCPQVYAAATAAVTLASPDLDFVRLDADRFSQSPDISIDYAILESASNIQMTSLEASWSDVGAWHSVAALTEPDHNGNQTQGSAYLIDSKNCYVNSENRAVSLLGVDNLMVIEREDAILITNSEYSPNVREVVDALRRDNHPAADGHPTAQRPWGSYRAIDKGEGFQVKHITVLPGRQLSLQKHFHRAEHWVVVSGTARVTCDDEIQVLEKNQSTFIPLEATHRLENIGATPLQLIEVQSGDYLGEDDIVRLEDNYGRL